MHAFLTVIAGLGVQARTDGPRWRPTPRAVCTCLAHAHQVTSHRHRTQRYASAKASRCPQIASAAATEICSAFTTSFDSQATRPCTAAPSTLSNRLAAVAAAATSAASTGVTCPGPRKAARRPRPGPRDAYCRRDRPCLPPQQRQDACRRRKARKQLRSTLAPIPHGAAKPPAVHSMHMHAPRCTPAAQTPQQRVCCAKPAQQAAL